MVFIPFFWDSNRFFDIIDSVDKWHVLLDEYTMEKGNERAEYYRAIGQEFDRNLAIAYVLSARRAELSAEHNFVFPPEVVSGLLVSFGDRREHRGTQTLEQWATSVGMDLRKL